jgi:hypothetical protein
LPLIDRDFLHAIFSKVIVNFWLTFFFFLFNYDFLCAILWSYNELSISSYLDWSSFKLCCSLYPFHFCNTCVTSHSFGVVLIVLFVSSRLIIKELWNDWKLVHCLMLQYLFYNMHGFFFSLCKTFKFCTNIRYHV